MRTVQPFREPEIEWQSALSHLDERGFAILPAAIAKETCEEIAALYRDEHRFRSRIDRCADGAAVDRRGLGIPGKFRPRVD